MKVIHLACVGHPHGGMGTVAGREVALLRARGVEAKLILPAPAEPSRSDERERSFVTYVPPLIRFGNAAVLPHLRALIAHADVVHLHYPFYGVAEPLLLFHRPTDAPVIMTFHMDAAISSFRGRFFALHRFLLQPFLLRSVARIFVSSLDYVKKSSLRSWFLRHPDLIQELPFGVDTDFFSPAIERDSSRSDTRADSRKRFQVLDQDSALLFVGGLDRAHAFKGLSYLFKAMSLLPPSVHLLIVGDGDLRGSYEVEAHNYHLHARTHFLGRVDDATLRDAYRVADVFVFPSINEAEAFGLVALEAGACGLPVVASDLPGVRTVVRHGETGWLVPSKDPSALASACLTLLQDPAWRARLGAAARASVMERFSWDVHVDQLLACYRSLCASRF